MAQFTAIFTDGGRYYVTTPDKYAAIEKAKSQKNNSDRVGVKEVKDAHGNKV